MYVRWMDHGVNDYSEGKLFGVSPTERQNRLYYTGLTKSLHITTAQWMFQSLLHHPTAEVFIARRTDMYLRNLEPKQ